MATKDDDAGFLRGLVIAAVLALASIWLLSWLIHKGPSMVPGNWTWWAPAYYLTIWVGCAALWGSATFVLDRLVDHLLREAERRRK